MEFTGERVVPGRTDPDLLNEHIARYGFAEELVSGKRVLDAGCGVGYGAQRLARRAARVTALDITLAPLLESRSKYGAANADPCQADCGRLPFRSESFDVVVAFETIEHLSDAGAFLGETARVLTPPGLLIVSTPNRDYYEESRAEPNPFHVREFSHEEFREELESRFSHVTLFLENHSHAITFTPLEVKDVRTMIETSSAEPEQAHFFVAVCSRRAVRNTEAFLYLPRAGNILREREKHIQLLKQEVMQKERWLAETTADLKRLDEIYRGEQHRAQEAINGLEKELQERTEWAQRLDEIYRGEQHRAQEAINGLEKELQERTEWAQRLDRELKETCEQLARIYASPAYRAGKRLGLAPPPQTPRASPEA